MTLVHNDDTGTIYDSNNKLEGVARSQITEQKISQLKKNQQNIERLINDNINKRTVRNYRQELINSQIDSEKGTQNNYIQKSMASLTEPITQNQTYLYPNSAPPTNANPSYLEHTTTFTDKNITYELIEKIKKKSVLSPYSETTLDRMEETFRTDGVAKRGELKKWDFILGAEMKIILKLTNDYDTKEDYRKMNKVIMKFVPYRTALNEAKYILNNIDFKNALHDSGVQSSNYGRGAIEKIRSIDKTIIGLNVLETRFMGNPIYLPINSITHLPIDSTRPELVTNQIDYANPNQRVVRSRNIYWKLFGIEYLDPEDILNSNNPDNKEILMMKDLIYIVRDDVSVSAGTKGFGLSELEPSLDGSETKRIMKSYDFKEISRSSYSSFGVIQALNSQISKSELQYLVDSMEVNGWCATAHQVTIDTFSLNSDARIMIEILDTMNRETGRDLDIPSPLLGYEHVQNYASLQQTLQSWKESVLDADRRRIKEIIEKQLLEEILDTSLKRQGYCIKLNERFELQLYQLDPFTGDIKYEIVIDPATAINNVPEDENKDANAKEDNLNRKTVPKPDTKTGTFAFPPNNSDNPKRDIDKKKSELENKDTNTNEGKKPNVIPNANSDTALNPTRFIKRPVKPTLLYHDEITGKIEMVEVPPIKLSFEITDPNFSIFKDKGEIGIQLKNINAISVEKLLELVDMPDEIDDALKREAEAAERAKQQHDLMMMTGQNEMNTKSRLADEQIQNLRTERKAVGGAGKYLEDDTDDKEKQKFEDDALKKKITDKKEKGRY